jgi:hypothetical protein
MGAALAKVLAGTTQQPLSTPAIRRREKAEETLDA